jgi:hypothetical protein
MREMKNKKDVITIVNVKQALFYIQSGLIPLNISVDRNSKRVVFMFNREETVAPFSEWCNRRKELTEV